MIVFIWVTNVNSASQSSSCAEVVVPLFCIFGYDVGGQFCITLLDILHVTVFLNCLIQLLEDF